MTLEKTIKPYGLWASPITAASLTASAIRIGNMFKDGESAWYHAEMRPSEAGRTVLIRHTVGSDEEEEANGKSSNARSEVHEYGGAGACALGGHLVYTEFRDRRLFLKRSGADEAVPILEKSPDYRFADMNLHPSLSHLLSVREFHEGEDKVVNDLVVIDIPEAGETSKPVVVASGRDFFTAPRFSPNGEFVAWIEWDLPEMPWTKSDLVFAKWDPVARKVTEKHYIETTGSVSQPRWASDDVLFYCCDKTGYYNIYQYNVTAGASEAVLKAPFVGDFSSPDWTLGAISYDFTTDGQIVTAHTESGASKISIINPATKSIETLVSDYVVGSLVVVRDVIYVYAGSSVKTTSLFSLDIKSKAVKTIKVCSQVNIEEGFLSPAQVMEIPTPEYPVYANYYAPKNPNFAAPQGDQPPLVVLCHGGPTASSPTVLAPSIQYWTSRGFAILDVNYSGSSGFGRDYRDRLNGNWGIVDVNDVCNAALHMAKVGLADPKKLCIAGGSAGGFTVLAALAFRPDVFAAGNSRYGICDLVSLAKLTHKFESRYIDILMGGSVSAIEDVYIKRSPIHSAGNISAALLVQQGDEDKVVPPNQAELIVEAIKKRGGVVEYELYAGEGHGWRKSENIVKAIEAELSFYLRNLKIEA